eukprot:scpid73409/ scgid30151/ 
MPKQVNIATDRIRNSCSCTASQTGREQFVGTTEAHSVSSYITANPIPLSSRSQSTSQYPARGSAGCRHSQSEHSFPSRSLKGYYLWLVLLCGLGAVSTGNAMATLQRLQADDGPKDYKKNRIETSIVPSSRLLPTLSPDPLIQVKDRVLPLGRHQHGRGHHHGGELPSDNRELLHQQLLLDTGHPVLPTLPALDPSADALEEQCELRRRQKRTNFAGCYQQYVTVNVCGGRCRSQGRPRTATRTKGRWVRHQSRPFIQSSCRCCRATGFERQQITMVCLRNDRLVREKHTFVNPTSCACERCSSTRARFYL